MTIASTAPALAGAHPWRTGRCPCCYKKTEIVIDLFGGETASGWCNRHLDREWVRQLAREGTCPWCGRKTTIVARILIHRFEPTYRRYDMASR